MPRHTVALLVALLAAGPLQAQRPRLEITLPSPARLSREAPVIRAREVISDSATKGLLESGFPTRLHFRAELWSSGGFFNAMLERAEWDLYLHYDPLRKQYLLERVEGEREEVTAQARFSTFAAAAAEVERPLPVPIRPRPHRDRQYYIVVVEVETLSANDLDELDRWLRGELRPAVRGEGNPGTAVGRGLRRLFVRLLGAERRNLQVRSPTFRIAPESR